MRRVVAAVASAAVLVSLLPGVVGAYPVAKFNDHVVWTECFGEYDDGTLLVYAEESAEFGSFGAFNAWEPPAIPFESDPTIFGNAEAALVVEGDPDITISATFFMFDVEGNDIGLGTFEATLQFDGPAFDEEMFQQLNRHNASVVTHQPLSGTATFEGAGIEATLDCIGEIIDLDVFESNPASFVNASSGVNLECTWEDEENGVFAALFATSDEDGFRADAFLESSELLVFTDGSPTGSLDTDSLDAEIPMVDDPTGDAVTATASATLELTDDVAVSTLIEQNTRTKVTEQAIMVVDGSLSFSTGHEFTLDDEACNVVQFSNHVVGTPAKGPKGAKAPANDTPEGAIAIEPGDVLNAQTTGAARDPEVPNTTCPAGESDRMGNTVWYTFEGTGEEMTIDTSGSNFDTVVAAYVLEGDELLEVACIDDLILDPVGASYQAVLTLPTEDGRTYWIQAGGFDLFFLDAAESGRLRLALD